MNARPPASRPPRKGEAADPRPDSPIGARSIERLIEAAQQLRATVERLRFSPPIAHVYNPLDYAWPGYEAYLRKFAAGQKRVVFLGMNPGPFGMVQTGIPFGEIRAVRDWMKISEAVRKPALEHARRPVAGFACERSEVSGQRLWGLFAQRFGEARSFFERHFVLNYCPLAFMEETGRNRTPDKLPSGEKEGLFEACNLHLREAINALQPDWILGVGDFARSRAELVFPGGRPKVSQILHPSPANPAANRAWAATVTEQLQKLGVWT